MRSSERFKASTASKGLIRCFCESDKLFKTQRCGCSSSSSIWHVPISAHAKEAKIASTCILSRLKRT